jgi:phenylalanyl-tRNA synthetase beta chain
MVGAGLLETRPMPFVHGAEGDFVRVANPLAENEAFLRREVLDTLARRAEYNLSHMQGNVRLFEIGAVFYPGTTALPIEELHAAALVMGLRRPPHFTDPKSEDFEASMVLDEWDAKALAERLVRAAYPASTYEMQPSAHRESTLWDIVVDGAARGTVRRVALDAPVWAKPVYGVELSLGATDSSPVAPPGASAHRAPEYIPSRGQTYRTLPTTPASEFDLALVVPDRTTAAEIEAVIRRSSGDLLESLQLVDQYAGKNIEAGHRSLAWRLTFRHPERTLGAKEIEGRRSKILRTLESELNVRQRSS